jgi:run domain Beclin-1 interacting cysteine-rich containing protein
VINIYEENQAILKKVTLLRQVMTLREKSILTSPYIRTCRFAEVLKKDLEDMLKLEKAEVFSLNDFCSIRLGIYLKRLKSQLDLAIKHILQSDCALCLAKGFYCEKCRQSDLLFPFQNEVYQCPDCFACFHQTCFKTNTCGKCLRQKSRDNLTVNKENFPELS